jgi:glycosyltransferase involved in cell wall biosynthesis
LFEIKDTLNKRIIIIYAKGTEEIFNRQSALGSYIHCLSTILVKNGYKVSVNDLSFNIDLKQQNVFSVNSPSSSFLKKLIPDFLKEVLKQIKLFQRLDNLYTNIDKKESSKLDYIIEFYTYGSDLGYKLSKKYKKPLLLIYDNPVKEEYQFFHGKQLFFRNRVKEREKNSILQARKIVVYSNAVKEYLNSKYAKKLPVFIHQNVDYTRFDFINNKTNDSIVNIGFIGSFLKWHRVDLLIKAFVRLRSEGKKCRLYLIGNGMEFNSIQQMVYKSGFRSDISLPGFADGELLLEYKQKMDIGVMPGSNWYGAPNKIFEYGAAKIAVVAPDTLTIKDLFKNGEELLLFEQDNENCLYQALSQYFNDSELRHKHALVLQNKIRNNYSENITFTFYNQLLLS